MVLWHSCAVTAESKRENIWDKNGTEWKPSVQSTSGGLEIEERERDQGRVLSKGMRWGWKKKGCETSPVMWGIPWGRCVDRQLHEYTPGYQWSYPHPYLEEIHTCSHGYRHSHGLRKMDLHPYPEDTHTHGCGYGYGRGLRKVNPGYDPPWVICTCGYLLDDMDELGRKTAIPGDHHKC